MIGRAFLTGALTVVLLALIALPALTIVADANNWGSFGLSLGPLVVFNYESTRSGFATTFGPGIAVVALAAGAVNALGAKLLVRDGGS